MIALKNLQTNPSKKVTIEIDESTLCDLHNIVYNAARENSKYEALDLEVANIYEMLHNGCITDFGIYKNAKYFVNHDSFENWGKKPSSWT